MEAQPGEYDFGARYNRQLQLHGFGAAGQLRLQQAAVLVIGAGGLGVPVLQYLAGMGVGRIGIADGDAISLHNLHRQVLYTTGEVGLLKAVVAADKLKALNPAISIASHTDMLHRGNALSLIAPYDLVVDATDNFSARYLINDACVLLGKPFVYGALHQFEGHVSVFNYQDGPTYRCLYRVPPAAGEIPDCNTAGVLGIVPGIIGSYQALEAVKVLTGIGQPLSGRLRIFDLLNDDSYTMHFKAVPANKQLKALQDDYALSCGPGAAQQLAPEQLLNWYTAGKQFFVLDVREPYEYEQGHLTGAHLISLPTLHQYLATLPAQQPIVVVCQKGGRSRQAVQLLQKQAQSLLLYELQGGMEHWWQQVGQAHTETYA